MNSPGPGATEAAPSDYLSALISSFLGWTLLVIVLGHEKRGAEFGAG